MPEVPPYRRIADVLRARIVSGDLAPGGLVPSARAIARDHGVALATATKVLAVLRDDGLVHMVPGVGTLVVERGDRSPAATPRRGCPPSCAPPTSSQPPSVAPTTRGSPGSRCGASPPSFGVATMSLYSRVRSKDELLVPMVDAVFAESPPPAFAPSDSWRSRVDALAHLQWGIHLRHPWTPALLSLSRPQNSPHGMRHTEALLQAFDGFGLSATELMHAAVVVSGYVRGCATDLEAELRSQQDTGLTADQWIRANEPAYESTRRDRRLPDAGRDRQSARHRPEPDHAVRVRPEPPPGRPRLLAGGRPGAFLTAPEGRARHASRMYRSLRRAISAPWWTTSWFIHQTTSRNVSSASEPFG